MYFKNISAIYLFLILLSFTATSDAQINPEPPKIPSPIREDRVPPLRVPKEKREKDTPVIIPNNLNFKKIKVQGNTVFSKDEIYAVISEYLNRDISFLQLINIADKITQLYVNDGYINSGAFIPQQEFLDRVATIQIIEGELEKINITGLKRLNSGYVRSRIEKNAKKPLNRDRLLKNLQLLQLDPLIEDVSAELSPGDGVGKTILNVEIVEADAFALQLTLDNQRPTIVGTFRRKIDIEHLNLFGLGDRFTVGYVNTDGSNSLNNLSYTIPINASNGTISFAHSRTASNLINLDPDFNPIDITSNTIDYNLTYRQPLYQTVNQEFAIGATFSLSENETLGIIENEAFPITIEANERGEINIAVIRLFQEYLYRDSRSVFLVRSEFNLGVDVFDATIDNNPQFYLADSEFLAWRGQAQYLRLLNQEAPFTTLLLRGNLQFANDILLAREQFTLGGINNGRGYPRNAAFGDNGAFLSAELRQPILSIEKWNLDLQIAPFIDLGATWNDPLSLRASDSSLLLGIGTGLILNIGNNFDARLDWGIPLNDLGLPKNNLQENGIYFKIRYQL